MALTLLIMLTTTHFEDLDLVVATLRYDSNQHRCTLDQRRTEFNGIACAHCEHLIQSDLGANVCRYLFYFKFFTSSNFVLFAAGFYDRVHVKPHRMNEKIFFSPKAQPYEKRLLNRENLQLYIDLAITSKGLDIPAQHRKKMAIRQFRGPKLQSDTYAGALTFALVIV